MRHFILTLALIASISSWGQSKTDSITIQKSFFGGHQFYQNNNKIPMGEVVKLMESNDQAYKHIKSAQSGKTLATVFGVIGGFMVGWTLGGAVAGNDANWTVAGIGAGMIVVGIPFNQKFIKQSKLAIDIYNQNLKASSFLHKTEIDFRISGNAVGLVLKF